MDSRIDFKAWHNFYLHQLINKKKLLSYSGQTVPEYSWAFCKYVTQSDTFFSRMSKWMKLKKQYTFIFLVWCKLAFIVLSYLEA